MLAFKTAIDSILLEYANNPTKNLNIEIPDCFKLTFDTIKILNKQRFDVKMEDIITEIDQRLFCIFN